MFGTTMTPIALLVSVLALGTAVQAGDAGITSRHVNNAPGQKTEPGKGQGPGEQVTMNFCIKNAAGENLCGTLSGVMGPGKPKGSGTHTQKPPVPGATTTTKQTTTTGLPTTLVTSTLKTTSTSTKTGAVGTTTTSTGSPAGLPIPPGTATGPPAGPPAGTATGPPGAPGAPGTTVTTATSTTSTAKP